ncbi:hypothetical protein SUDANB95_07363 [Actinosynnema sp. ALI-1.44]
MTRKIVRDLVAQRVLLVEDGNHGEYRPRPDEFVDIGVPFIRAADMSSGTINFDRAGKINKIARNRIRKGIGKPGDVILSHKGTVGRVAVAPMDSPDFVCSPQTTFWRSLNPAVLNQRYLRYAMCSPSFMRQLEVLKGQTDMAPYVSLTDQRSIELELPPIETQQAVAEALGALDDKIAVNDHLAVTALELARVMYKKIMEGKPRISMSRILVPILGGTPSRSDDSLWNGSVAWASAKDVANAKRGVILSTSESITEQAASKTRTRTLPIGTVVLTARGTVGAVARLGVPAAINQSCYGFVPSAIPASCLFFAVEGAANQARSMAHGSVFDTITMSTFEHVQVPKLDNQEWLSVEERIAPILASSQQAVSESKKLAATREELLPLLMSGKIRVREAESIVEGVV